MAKYFTLGAYSISFLHHNLYHWDEREFVFLRPIKLFENLSVFYFGYTEDMERMQKIWNKRIADDPTYMAKYGQEHEKNFKNLNNYLDMVLPQTKKADRKKISGIFKEYWHLLYLAEPIGDINMPIDEIYSRRVNNEFQELLESKGKKDMFTEYIIDLTTPWEMLPTQKEEIEFLELVKKVREGKVEDVRSTLKKHLNKYEWIPVWYDNDPWKIDYLQERLNSELKDKNIDTRLKHLKGAPAYYKKRVQELIKELNIEGRLLQDLEGLRYFTYIRTAVDIHTSYVAHKARPIYERIVELLGITFHDLKFLTPEEIIDGLSGKLSTNDLYRLIKPRQDFAVQIFDKDKQTVLVGKEARDFAKPILADLEEYHSHIMKRPKDETHLNGAGASKGKAKGPARIIISRSELPDMREGEVLIVPATSVDFITAMKKSVAIVTDHGGLTCHAAIVARELDKPCVVNTLVATKFFKNGDMVEVDAIKGIVRKL